MCSRYLVDDSSRMCSLLEESGFFRLKLDKPVISEADIEDFLDTTVEWLSGNPSKGILIDFDGVKSVSKLFSVALARHYEDIKRRGLYVRFVNVDPAVEKDIDVSNITVVVDLPIDELGEVEEDLETPQAEEKHTVKAREVLIDLANNVSNLDLMKKHNLSAKGLESLYRKLLRSGLITKETLGRRLGIKPAEVPVALSGLPSRKAKVEAREVLKDLSDGMSDHDLMIKYHLSPKGLRSLMTKLVQSGLLSEGALSGRTPAPEE
ncbi:MAG: STAS domain-containing protein [Thermodesulfobacteriota bacterium]